MSAVIDPTTGEVLGTGAGDELDTDDVDELRRLARAYRAQADGLKQDVDNLEKEARNHRRKITALEGELRKQLQEADEEQYVRTLFNYWIEKTGRNPKRTKLGDARRKKVLARLREGHSPERIMRAIDGAALAATTSRANDERQALIAALERAKRFLSDEQVEAVRGEYRRVMGSPERFDDLELICRDETKVERFAAIADRLAPLPDPHEAPEGT